jgi:hypothetical protein
MGCQGENRCKAHTFKANSAMPDHKRSCCRCGEITSDHVELTMCNLRAETLTLHCAVPCCHANHHQAKGHRTTKTRMLGFVAPSRGMRFEAMRAKPCREHEGSHGDGHPPQASGCKASHRRQCSPAPGVARRRHAPTCTKVLGLMRVLAGWI